MNVVELCDTCFVGLFGNCAMLRYFSIGAGSRDTNLFEEDGGCCRSLHLCIRDWKRES